jgi:lipid-A-disaccharide synthase-like uncharacterized protein
MEALLSALFSDGRFLGIQWHVWKVVGWTGNAVFFSRFIVQWLATERRKQVVVPTAFWWLSLTGTLLMLSYAVFFLRDSVIIFANCFSWIPYVRNLIIHRRHKEAQQDCPECATLCPPHANYCFNCGTPLRADAPAPTARP